ncbi:MAG: dihydropteroate synthase, partial [Campylobacter sp.]|nr:dihydropteroate synthase [Campylobacter sp.]
MKIQKISAKSDFNALCAKLKVHKMGKKIMSEKKELHFFLIKEISLAAINILKQDALSCGAEVLSPENAILGGKELSTAVLIANEKQLKSLEKKEALQDFGLKELSKYLKLEFLNTKISPNPEIMGVLNITDDSFNPKSRVDEKSIANRASQMIESGAIWLDIGAASTHPD